MMTTLPKLKVQPWLWVCLILGAAALILYYKPFFGGYVFTGPDSLAPSGTSAGIKALEKETGRVTLWMPWLFSGMPTIHSFTYLSMLYLPNSVLRLLSPILPGFSSSLLHLIFAGLGCYLLVRRIGGSFYAGLLSGTGFMLMPYLNTMLVHGHGSQMMTLVYLPWLIWGILRLYERTTLASAALLALLVGLQLQRGHAQIAYYNLLMLGLFFMVMVVRSWRDSEWSVGRRWRLILFFILAVVIGFGLAAALFLPVMNYTPYSIRGGRVGGGTGFEYATQWSFSLGETLTFLLPSFYGFGGATYWGDMPFTDYPNYMGILILFLAVWAIIFRRSWLVWTLTAAGFIAYLLSLGDNFFLYKVFYALMPYFNKFRVPSMLLVLTQFSVVILAGVGLDSLLDWLAERKSDRARRLLLGIAGGVVVLSVIFLIAASALQGTFPAARGAPAQMAAQIDNLRVSMIRSDALIFLVIGILAAAGLYLGHKGRLQQKWVLGILVALSMVDLGRVDRQIIDPPRESMRASVLRPDAFVNRYLNSDQVLDFLAADTTTFRIFPLGRLQNENRWATVGVQSIVGYHAAKLANYDRFMQATRFQNEGLLRMLNVKYLVSQQRFNDPRFRQAFIGNLYSGGTYQPAAVYELIDFLDRAWFPERVESRATAEDIFEQLGKSDYDPEKVVYLLRPESGDTLEAIPAAGTGRVLEAAWQADHLRLRVDADEPAFLVLSEIFYPEGWEAWIDGKPVDILEVNTIMRGVSVPGGTHEVVMKFRPSDWRWGRLLSRLSLLLVVLGFVPAAVQRIRTRT
ncbi:MAG: YfhO family protein [Fidelibacterota bacterium]|nr:MAG: YfhO family protein [Candidatus Neomarinimicrobiota bacterium]